VLFFGNFYSIFAKKSEGVNTLNFCITVEEFYLSLTNGISYKANFNQC